jgi:hypothetical protein
MHATSNNLWILEGIFLCKLDQTQGTCEDVNKGTKQACKGGK